MSLPAPTEQQQKPEPTPSVPAVPDAHGKALDAPKRRQQHRDIGIANIATAVAAVTREVGVVAKEGHNRFHGYRYARMEDVLQKLTPLIAKHGLMIVQTEIGRSMFDDDRAISVQYEFTIAHTSGELWPDRPKQTGLCRCRDSKGGFDDKALNKCHTAARKYFLLALFQIATGEEDDADQHQTGYVDQGGYDPRPAALSSAKKRPGKLKMREQIDPVTGEVLQPGASPSAPQARDEPATAASAATAAGAAPLSIEDMAREAALRGEDTFRAFWRSRSAEEQQAIGKIGGELRELMTQEGSSDEPQSEEQQG